MKRALDRSLVKTSRQYLLVHELKDILTDEFAEVSVEHVSRICNAVAHELASLGSFFQGEVVFSPGNLPDCIHVLVTSDLSGSQD
jgi:hypothetical protein